MDNVFLGLNTAQATLHNALGDAARYQGKVLTLLEAYTIAGEMLKVHRRIAVARENIARVLDNK